MIPQPPRSTRTYTLFPSTTLFRSFRCRVRPAISAFNAGDTDFVMCVPVAAADLLGDPMFGLLFPCTDRGLIAPVRHRDAEAVIATRAFGTEVAVLLGRQFEHARGSGLVSGSDRGAP